MIDLYLKAETQAALHSFLIAHGFERADARTMYAFADTGALLSDDESRIYCNACWEAKEAATPKYRMVGAPAPAVDEKAYQEEYARLTAGTTLEAREVTKVSVPSDRVYHPRVLLDEIGAIYKPTGAMMTDEDGNEWPEHTPIPGYHANLRVLDDELAADFAALALPEPATPARVWA